MAGDSSSPARAGDDAALAQQQAGVRHAVAVALLILLAASAATLVLVPPFSAADASAERRMLLWAKCLVPRAVCLAAAIAAVGNFRFNSAQDIAGAGLSAVPSAKLRQLQAVLVNTHEQATLAALASAAFAALAPARVLHLLPVAAGLFVAGRLLFVRGYERGAPSRSLGFALTMLPSYAMLGVSAVVLLTDPW